MSSCNFILPAGCYIVSEKVRDKEHSAEQKVTKCHVLREEDVNEFFE